MLLTEAVLAVALFLKELAFPTGTVHFMEAELLTKSYDMT